MLTTYTLRDIQTLLELSGLKASPDQTPAEDDSHHFDIYFRILPELNFLNDTVDYLLQKREQTRSRRVAFIIGQSSALLVEYNDLNISCKNALLTAIAAQNLIRADQIIGDRDLLGHVQRLYQSIKISYINLIANNPLLNSCYILLSRSYPEAQVTKAIIPLDQAIDSAIMIEMVLRQLHSNFNVEAIDSLHIKRSQQELCANAFIQWFAELQQENLKEHKRILTEIEISLKYTQLQQVHRLLDMRLLHKTHEALLDEVLEEYLRQKKSIFVRDQNLVEILPQLSVALIANLFRLRTNTTELLRQLQEGKNQQYQKICDWEQEKTTRFNRYQKHWRNWLSSKGCKATQCVYDNSLPKLGGEMVCWLAKRMNLYIPWESNWLKFVRHLSIDAIRLIVFFLTLSPVLANRSAASTALLLTKEGLLDLVKILGIDLGIILSGLIGMVHLLRMMLLPILVNSCRNYLKFERIHLETAQVHSYDQKLPSVSNFFRIISLLFAFVISFFQADFRMVTHTLSGILGSIALLRLGNRILDKFAQEIQLSLEDRAYFSFLLSIVGMEFGVALAENYDYVTDKIAARQTILDMFTQSVNASTTNPTRYYASIIDSKFSPMFWFTAKNRITLSWTETQHTYKTACQIDIDPNQAGVASIQCEAPQVVYALIKGPAV